MSHKRAVICGVAILILLFGAVVGRLADGGQAVVAQLPTIGPTNTVAAETAAVGATALVASVPPPTPTPITPAPPPPTLTSTPALRPTPTGSPAPTGTGFAPSSGSAFVPATSSSPPPSTGTGGSSAWPVVGVLAAIAVVVAVGIAWTRFGRGGSLRR
jgi:hypothetical protein